MKHPQQDETFQYLNAMLDETMQARKLTTKSDAIAAMRALLRAKRLGKKAIAALLGGCLKAKTEQADDESLARLRELLGFAQQALCPGCRSEVGRRWKEAEDV